MKIQFANSFSKSIKRLIRHQTWWYKTYEFFRRDLPYFLENIWFFRKELYAFRSWDYSFNLDLFRRSLEKTVDTIENYGHEVDESRLKKVEKMKRAIQLIKNVRSDEYVRNAEKELGKNKYINDKCLDVKELNGETIYQNREFNKIENQSSSDWIKKEIQELKNLKNLEIKTRTSVAAFHGYNYLLARENLTDHLEKKEKLKR